ncbi:uncharacterized protein PV07_12849, partial [Cladophialophora immunda]
MALTWTERERATGKVLPGSSTPTATATGTLSLFVLKVASITQTKSRNKPRGGLEKVT